MMFTSRGRGAAGLPGSFGVFSDVLGPGGDPGPPRRGGRRRQLGRRAAAGLGRHRVTVARLRACKFQNQPRNIQGECPVLLRADRATPSTSYSYRNFLRYSRR